MGEYKIWRSLLEDESNQRTHSKEGLKMEAFAKILEQELDCHP